MSSAMESEFESNVHSAPHQVGFGDHWDSIFAPTPQKPRQVFEPGSEEEIVESPLMAPKTISSVLMKDLSLKRSGVTSRLQDDDDIIFSAENSDGSNSPGEETSYHGSHDSSNSGHEDKRSYSSMTDHSLPDNHHSFDFPSNDHFSHTFILSPFAPRLNYHIDDRLTLTDIPHYSMNDDADGNADHQADIESSSNMDQDSQPASLSSSSNVISTNPEKVAPDNFSEKPVRRRPALASSTEKPKKGAIAALVVEHTGADRKFLCSFSGCDASFNRQSHLDRHFLSHTGERPFACVVEGCGKAFTRKEHLKRHIDNTHGSLANNV